MWILFYLLKITEDRIKDILKLTGIGFIAFSLGYFLWSIKSYNVSVALVCFSAVGFFTALEPAILRVKSNGEVLLGLLVIACKILFHFF
jgi:multidrug transporter EmrE-like cation transporter